MAANDTRSYDGFAGILREGLTALKTAIARKDFPAIADIGVEMVEVSNAFGRTEIAKSMEGMVAAARVANESAFNQAFADLRNTIRKTSRPTGNERPEMNQQIANTDIVPKSIRSTLPLDEPEFRDVVVEFIPTLQERINEIGDCLAAGNFDEVARLAHWLKGSGGTLGFAEFNRPSLDLESAAKNEDAAAATKQLEIIRALCNAIEIPELQNTNYSS